MDGYVKSYYTPMKSGNISHYLIDWTTEPEREKHLSEIFLHLYNNVSGSPRKYVDNTYDFVKWLVNNKSILNKKRSNKRENTSNWIDSISNPSI